MICFWYFYVERIFKIKHCEFYSKIWLLMKYRFKIYHKIIHLIFNLIWSCLVFFPAYNTHVKTLSISFVRPKTASRFHFESNHRVCERGKRADRKRTRVAIERSTNTIGDARLLKLEINRFCVVREGVFLVCENIPAFRRTSERVLASFIYASINRSARTRFRRRTCLAIFGVFSV